MFAQDTLLLNYGVPWYISSLLLKNWLSEFYFCVIIVVQYCPSFQDFFPKFSTLSITIMDLTVLANTAGKPTFLCVA